MPYSTCCQIDADMLPACYRHIMVRPECHFSLLSFTESGLSIYWGRKTERHPGKKRGTFQLFSYYGPNHPQVTPARSSPGGKPRREVRGPIPPAYLCRNREALGECQVEGKEPMHLSCPESSIAFHGALRETKKRETKPSSKVEAFGPDKVKLESRVMGDYSARFGEHNYDHSSSAEA